MVNSIVSKHVQTEDKTQICHCVEHDFYFTSKPELKHILVNYFSNSLNGWKVKKVE